MSIIIDDFTPLNDRLLELAYDLINAATEGVGPKEYHDNPKGFNMVKYLNRMSCELDTLAKDWKRLVAMEKEGN